MKVTSIQITNIKSLADSGSLHLSPKANVILGHNNAGKSILIRALYLLQEANSLTPQDIRVGTDRGAVRLTAAVSSEELKALGLANLTTDTLEAGFEFTRDKPPQRRLIRSDGGVVAGLNVFPAPEPRNAIYPFLGKRKVSAFDELVNASKAKEVATTFFHLTSKVDVLNTPSHYLFQEFRDHCQRIIGFPIDSVPSPGGHRVGIAIRNGDPITIENMGDGIQQMLALIADLCLAEEKLFLIEEPENDLHPRALKSLLDLIATKTASNQFVVTTHSNIVARYLGGIPGSKTFRVTLQGEAAIPTAKYAEVPADPEARRQVLEELGYEMTDYGLWNAWLILEESTAERVINDFLIPQFAPGLIGHLRTVAAGGVDDVGPKFDDFNRLFLFTHLAPTYKNRAWVIVDAGQPGSAVVTKLQARYMPSGWDATRFRLWKQSDFEAYYPPRFKTEVDSALGLGSGLGRQSAKSALMRTVLKWTTENPELARTEFEGSAAEVIALLREIEATTSTG